MEVELQRSGRFIYCLAHISTSSAPCGASLAGI